MLLAVAVVSPLVPKAQSVMDTVPYHCDFENETQNGRWTLVNGTCYNYLCIDTLANTTLGGHKALYMTQQFMTPRANAYKVGSSTAGDNTYVTSRVFAYTHVYFPAAGEYDVGYWWHCMGESIYDYGRVILTPSNYVFTASTVGWDTASSIPGQILSAVTTPNVCISLNGTEPLSGSPELRYHSQTFTVQAAGDYCLAVMWMNDGNTGENPPLLIDDISITPHTCDMPEDLMVNRLTDSSATLNWTGTAPLYEVKWDTCGSTWTFAHVDTVSLTSYTMNGLMPEAEYEFVVRALCTTSPSLMSMYHVKVPDTTCGMIYDFPYTFNFDSATSVGSADTPPVIPCWGHFNDANSASYLGYPYLNSNSSYVHTGTYALYFYYTSSANYPRRTGVYLPRIGDTVDIRNLVLDFWMASTNTSYHPRMMVGVMSDPFNVNSFVACDTVSTNLTTPQHFTVTLSNYEGNGRYVAIMNTKPTTGTVYYAYLDDITLNFESCIRPGIIDSDVQDTAASFTWANTGAYYYEWRAESPLSSDTSIHVTSDTTITFTGLQPNTDYTFYVRSHCATAGQWNTVNFTTACGMLRQFPWWEDFEDIPTGVRTSHPCWRFTSDGTGTYDGYYPYINSNSSYAYSGNYVYMYLAPANSTVNGYPSWECIALPELDTNIAMLNQLRLSFTAATSSSTYSDYLYIGTMSDPEDSTTFQVFDSVYVNTTRAHLYELDMFNATPHRSYLALKGYRHPTAYRYFYIDHVGLQLIPDCPRVQDVYVDNVTTSSADVHWRDTMSLGWNVYFGQEGFNYHDSTALAVNDTMISFTNLEPNTAYDVWILPFCDNDGVAEPLLISFRTHCIPLDTLPYIMDWENVGTSSTSMAPEIPCWSYITRYSSNYPYVSNTSSYQHLGSKALYWYHPTNYSTILGGPAISEDYQLQNVVVKIWVKPTSTTYVPTFEVGVMTDPYVDSTFVGCQTINTDGTSNWQELIGSLANYNGEGRYVALRCVNSTGGGYAYWYAYVDEITIDYTPCPPPVILDITATVDSAYITWTGTSDNYLVTLGGTGNNTDYISADTSISIGGLSPNTPYAIYVRGLCGGDSSDVVYENFRTECVAMDTLPFAHGFEGDPTGTAAHFTYCWHRTVNSNATNPNYPYVSSSTTNAHTGSGYLYWYASNSTSYPEYSIVSLPELSSRYNIANTTLSFWAKPTSASYHPVFVVGVVEDPDSAETFVAVDTIYVDNTTEWQGFETSFASYTGNGHYAAIKMFRPSSIWISYMDDIELFLTPNCVRPSHIAESNATTSGFDLTWDGTDSTQSYEVRITDINGVSTILTSTTNSLTVTGLTASSAYTVEVRSICSATDTSLWSFSHVAHTACGLISTFPYFQSFENDPVGSSNNNIFAYCWGRLNNAATYYGYPYISSSSTYAHTGGKGLYWYGSTTTGTYGDHYCIILPEVDTTAAATNTLTLSFWAKSSSTSYTPVFKVGVLTDPEDITTFVGIDTITISGNTAWTEYTSTFESYTGQGSYVAIKADRPTSTWYAYMDDITLNHVTHCHPPYDVHTTSTTTDATITWSSDANNLLFSYRQVGDSGDFNTLQLTVDSVTLTGLRQNTVYEYQIVAICDTSDSSSITSGTFMTEICDNPEFDTIGHDIFASEYSYLPFYEYYQYTYSQQIIDSADLEGMVMLDAIEFLTNNPVSNSENCTIYIGHTTQTAFHGGASWIPADSLTAVYTGSMNMIVGWNRFAFDTAFIWDGHRNLVVGVLRAGAQDYFGANTTKRVNLMDSNLAIYAYSSGAPIRLNSLPGGTAVSYRSMMRLVTCGDRTCHTPVVTDSTTTYTTATLNWEGGIGDYEITARPLDDPMWPATITVSTDSYTFTGLMPGTTYIYNIRKVCDSNFYSDWCTGTFTTVVMPCDIPDNLTVLSTSGREVEIDWTAEVDTNTWQIHVFNTAFDYTEEVTAHPATITGLQPGTTYHITITSLCGGGIVTSDPSDTLDVTTDDCQIVGDITVTDITANSARVNWTAGSNNSGKWIVNYGYTGMTPGTNFVDTVTTTEYTLNGLEPETQYDIFIRSFCDEDWLSIWSPSATFTTQQGVGIGQPEANSHYALRPNPASQSTTVLLNGIEGPVTIALIDMTGRTLTQTTAESHGSTAHTLDLNGLAQGTYFVRICSRTDTYITKLVVK